MLLNPPALELLRGLDQAQQPLLHPLQREEQRDSDRHELSDGLVPEGQLLLHAQLNSALDNLLRRLLIGLGIAVEAEKLRSPRCRRKEHPIGRLGGLFQWRILLKRVIARLLLRGVREDLRAG